MDMELVFESTKNFEKDLRKFEKKDQVKIIEKLNNQCNAFINDKSTFNLHILKPFTFILKDGLQPTLYCLRVSKDIRIILTVDEDPIFEQTIFTLLRVVRHDGLNTAYKSIGELLYQQFLLNEKTTGGQ